MSWSAVASAWSTLPASTTIQTPKSRKTKSGARCRAQFNGIQTKMLGIIAAGFCSGGVGHSWESCAGVCSCFTVLSCCLYCLQLAAHGCSKFADGIAVVAAAGHHCASLSVLLLDLADHVRSRKQSSEGGNAIDQVQESSFELCRPVVNLVCCCVLLLADCLLALRSAISLHLGFN